MKKPLNMHGSMHRTDINKLEQRKSGRKPAFSLCARRAHVLTGESPQTALFSGKVTAKVKGGPVKGAWRKMEAKP